MGKPRIGVVGRDMREWHAAVELSRDGYDVAYMGPVPVRGILARVPPIVYENPQDLGLNRRVLVGPVRGWMPEDTPSLVGAIEGMAPRGLVVTGKPPAAVVEACRVKKHRLVDILQRDDFAHLNAVPTAEGAIAEAMAAANITLAGSRVAVIGYGRTGSVLARRLKGMGSLITVVARSPHKRAAARVMDYKAADMGELPRLAASSDFIFNTVPAPIMTAKTLSRCPAGTVIIDLASEPGGVDRAAVEKYGIVFRWPLGIPGQVAPRTAGHILHQVVITIMVESGVPVAPRRPGSHGSAVEGAGLR